MEANSADQTIQSFAENILRLGNECRALADENKILKSKIEMLERQVNYWRIEANVDQDRWLRSLEEIDHIRKLK